MIIRVTIQAGKQHNELYTFTEDESQLECFIRNNNTNNCIKGIQIKEQVKNKMRQTKIFSEIVVAKPENYTLAQ